MMDLSSPTVWADFGRAALTDLMLFANQAEGTELPAEEGMNFTKVLWLVGIAAVLILPFMVGNAIAKQLRLPADGTRLGIILLAITASVSVLSLGTLKYGVDLRGGTILVYEMDPESAKERAAANEQRITAEDLVPSLVKRINPSGTQEIVVRPYGEEQIEIIIPEVDQFEVDRIKGVIEQAGILRFAIIANGRDDSELIALARERANSEDINERMAKSFTNRKGTPIGFWATVDRETKAGKSGVQPLRVAVSGVTVRNRATGEILDIPPAVAGNTETTAAYLQSIGVQEIQALMATRPGMDVTGEDLAMSSRGVDEKGSPAVNFKMDGPGSRRFLRLTSRNKPDGNFFRRLGIVLDDDLLSAPQINSPINGTGIITGEFTAEEVDRLVDILQAGQLPAALTKQPIAENQIGSTLGHDTITKGVWAIGGSLFLVLLFIVFYYRFAGIIACSALILNLVMTLAVMILINQPITLPGLAGLVLTVGMSVDANVLIFERIREELKKGAADRMAIRNGFARATTTIVDANLTTLITAIVLYAIGTDQIRGFAVTLILGILFSMFTAIYMSRTFFDIADRRGFADLRMSDLVTQLRGQGPGFNFINLARVTFVISALLVVGGIAAIFARGSSILDIDFAGGSSVTFQLQEPVKANQVRKFVDEALNPNEDEDPIVFTLNSVTINSLGDNASELVYKVDTGLEDVNELKDKLRDGFSKNPDIALVTYDVNVSDGNIAPTPPVDADKPAPKESDSSYISSATATQFVAFRSQDEGVEPETPAEPEAAPAEDAAPAEPAASADDAAPAEPKAPADDAAPAAEVDPATPPVGVLAPQPAVKSEAPRFSANITLAVEGNEDADTAQIKAEVLRARIYDAAKKVGVELGERAVDVSPTGEGTEQWNRDSALTFSHWNIELRTDPETGLLVTQQLKESLGSDPVWISSSSIGKRVAGDMIRRAGGAMFASLLCIIGYIWFRFQHVMYGLAAVAALVHDVIITLGAIAISFWVADALGFLLVDQFKISLTVVAALLTIVGYSLNDTIVVFDRIRETKGKSPRLTEDMVNSSITQTLSRTLLTSLTTLFVVAVLYAFGGEGIHAFAFALVVGVLVGTYSSIFVASPILLWMIQRYQPEARNA